MLDFLGRFVQTRRVLRTLERIASALESQSAQLHRLADHLCGAEVEATSDADLKVHSGVTFSSDSEQVWVLDVIDRFRRASGREPTEDELNDLLMAKRT